MSAITVDLEEAERAGVISPGQAEVLRRTSNPAADDEPIAVTNRFSEVFVAVGCAILLQGAHAVLPTLGLMPLPASLAVLAIAWVLAEILHWRRMGFATGFCVLLAATYAIGIAHAAMAPSIPPAPGSGLKGYLATRPAADIGALLLAATATLTAGLARFRIPFLVFPVAAAASAALAYYLGSKGQLGSLPVLATIGVAGTGLLALGVMADSKDPERKGKPSQYAFWLFVAASPMTVHPFLILTLTQLKGVPSSVAAGLVIAISLAVTLLGLVLDRRGPVVSTLLYVTVAVGYLLKSPGAATLLIGLYVLSLGLLWKSARRAIARTSFLRRSSTGGMRPTGGFDF